MTPIVPQDRPPGPGAGGTRQLQADFAAGALRLGLNATVRPDALVLDPLVAYSLGPVAQGDQSQGPVAWAWRIRVDAAGVVQLARENDARNGWNAETAVFTIVGSLAIEADLSFEQASRVVVTVQRNTGAAGAPEVWLYYFNPLTSGFVFESFGAGRTPRLILDNPQTPSISDVLLAYLNPTLDRLELRQQRDRYVTAYPAPLTLVSNLYLEELVLTVDNRIRCILSVRDVPTGTYSQRLLDSTLYPFALRPDDAVRPAHPVLTGGTLVTVIILITDVSSPARLRADDAVRPAHPLLLVSSVLETPLILITDVSSPARLRADDAVRPAHPLLLVSSTLATPLILITDVSSPARLRADDAVRPAHPLLLATSTLVTIVIVIDQSSVSRLRPDDALRPAHPLLLNTSTLA